MKQALFLSGLLLLVPLAAAVAEPFKLAEPIAPDEDVLLAERYGADYSPQTDAGKKAQAVIEAANSGETCTGPTWTARAKCQNDLRDKAAMASNVPWMDLIRVYDAKILEAAAEADAKHIQDADLAARMKSAGTDLQQAVAQRMQAAQETASEPSHARRPAVLLPPSATSCAMVAGTIKCSAD